MFSKAKLKRFNEEIGCAPPPTAYNPKCLDKPCALSIDKSDRWREHKLVTPAPNAYGTVYVQATLTPRHRSSIPRPAVLKPNDRTLSASALNTSAASNLSSNASFGSTKKKNNAFVSPRAPRLVRSSSVRSKAEKMTLVQQVCEERDLLQEMVLSLQKELDCLQHKLSDSVAAQDVAQLEKEVQTEASSHEGADGVPEPLTVIEKSTCIQKEVFSKCERSVAIQQETECIETIMQTEQLPLDDLQLLHDQIHHLTQLRDNLEASVACKDATINQLQLECQHLSLESRSNGEAMDRCNEQLKALEAKLTESFLDAGSGPCDYGDNTSLCGVVCRVSGLLSRYEALLHTHTDHTQHCSLQLHTLNETVAALQGKLTESFLDAGSGPCDYGDNTSLCGVVCRVSGLLSRYEALLHTHTDHTQHCSLQLHTLNETVAALQGKVSEYEQEVSRLRVEDAEKVARISTLEETLSELSASTQGQQALMQDELRQRNPETSMLKEAYTSLEQKLAEAELRAASAVAESERREEAEKRVQELLVMVREAQVLQHFLEKEVLAREQEVNASSCKVEELNSEMNTARQEALDLKGEAEAQLNQMLVLKASMAAKDYDIDERDETIFSLKEEIEVKQDLISDLQEMLTAQKADKAELTLQLEGKLSSVAALEASVAEATRQLQVKAEQFDQQQREKDVGMSCLKDLHEAAMCGLRDEKDGLLKRVRSLEEQCREAEDVATQLRDKLRESESTIKRLEEKLVEVMSELEDAEITSANRIQEVQSEVDELSAQYSEALLELEARRQALLSTTEEQEEIEGHYETMLHYSQKAQEQLTDELSSVRSQLSSSSEQFSTLEHSLKQLSDKYISLEKAKDAESADMNELLQRLRGELLLSQQQGAAQQQQLSQMQSSNTGFMTQIQQLRQDLTKKATTMEESKICIELLREEKAAVITSEQEVLLQHTEVQKELNQLKLQFMQLQEERDQAHANLSQTHEELLQAQESRSQVQQELAMLHEAQQQNVAAAAELSREAEKRQAAEAEEVQRLHQTVQHLEEQLDAVLDVKENFVEKVISLENTVETLTVENNMAKESYLQLEQRSNTFLSALANSSAREELLQGECSSLQLRLQKMEEEAESVVTEKTAIQKRISELEDELQRERKLNDNAMQNLDKLLHQSDADSSCKKFSEDPEPGHLEERLATLERCLTELQSQRDEWRDKYATLEKLIEPFREQLESYEAERAVLQSTRTAAQREVAELSQKYTSLLGHQNHKQKIHHVAKLKNENNRLIEEVAKLRVECDRQRKTARRLEDHEGKLGDQRRKTLAGERAVGKENTSEAPTFPCPRSPLRPSNKFN